MVNRERGEAAFTAGGKTYTLCLTLKALAEIENGLGVNGMAPVIDRARAMRADDAIVFLTALLRGGGHDVSAEEVGDMPARLFDMVSAIGEAIIAAGVFDPAGGGEDGNETSGTPEKNRSAPARPFPGGAGAKSD